MRSLTITLIALILLTGCSRQVFVINDTPGRLVYENHDIFFVGGLAQTRQVSASDICNGANNIASVEVQHTLIDILAGSLTSSLVAPKTSRVFCTTPKRVPATR